MASLPTLRDGLKTRLQTITGLRAHDTIPEQLSPPAAVVGFPTDVLVSYDLVLGGGATYRFAIRLYVGRASDRGSQDAIDPYISDTGAKSIKAAIEGDTSLGGVAQTLRVTDARGYGIYEVAGTPYLGCEFLVEVLTA